MICWRQIELADELLYLTEVRGIRHLSCHMSASVSSFERSARFSPLTQLILPFFFPSLSILSRVFTQCNSVSSLCSLFQQHRNIAALFVAGPDRVQQHAS